MWLGCTMETTFTLPGWYIEATDLKNRRRDDGWPTQTPFVPKAFFSCQREQEQGSDLTIGDHLGTNYLVSYTLGK